ncbi:hypothetical protein MTO96_042670, partial [Rhipicephalus appendiculatus]
MRCQVVFRQNLRRQAYRFAKLFAKLLRRLPKLLAVGYIPKTRVLKTIKRTWKAQGGWISAHIRQDTQGTAGDMVPLDQYLAL